MLSLAMPHAHDTTDINNVLCNTGKPFHSNVIDNRFLIVTVQYIVICHKYCSLLKWDNILLLNNVAFFAKVHNVVTFTLTL